MLAQLAELSSLTTPHYSFPIPRELLDPIAPELREYVRITRGISLSPPHHNEKCVRNAVTLCQEYDATIAINYSPYHVHKPAASDFGDAYFDSLHDMADGLLDLQTWIGNSVPVKMILLNCEHYWVRPEDTAEHRANVIRKYDIIYHLCKAIFPDADVEWYNRGGARLRRGTPDYWDYNRRFTGDEKSDCRSCALYSWEWSHIMQETWRHTKAGATAGELVNAWVSLGAGYTSPVIGSPERKWRADHDYLLGLSRLAGHLVNRVWKPDAVLFYPKPFDPRTSRWAEHFVEYVKGATE